MTLLTLDRTHLGTTQGVAYLARNRGFESCFLQRRDGMGQAAGRWHQEAMDVGALFGLSVLLSFCAFGVVTILYILP
jgi:hypothetical protein